MKVGTLMLQTCLMYIEDFFLKWQVNRLY
jgi:hypothetical protein